VFRVAVVCGVVNLVVTVHACARSALVVMLAVALAVMLTVLIAGIVPVTVMPLTFTVLAMQCSWSANTARCSCRQDVAGEAVVRESGRCGGGAVVHLVHARSADGQRPRGDVGGAVGWVNVVAGAGALMSARYRDRLARANVLLANAPVGAGGIQVTVSPLPADQSCVAVFSVAAVGRRRPCCWP